MAAGDTALTGDSGSVRDVGSDLRGRTFGTDVGAKLIDAAYQLGLQSGAAVSVDRITAVIQSALAPAGLVQVADLAWGDAAESYGAQMEDIARRANSEQVTLALAKVAAAASQKALSEASGADADDADAQRERRGLMNQAEHAGDAVAASEQRLMALDEERRGIDATAATALAEAVAQYTSIRSALPSAPQLSAGVEVSVAMPDGTVRSFSAVDLAKLKDPAVIRAVWDAMTPEQRDALITDYPMLIGNLEGIPLRDRNTANVITAQAHRAELEKQIELLSALWKQGQSVEMNDPIAATKVADLEGLIADLKGEVKSIDAMLGDRNEKYARPDDDEKANGQVFGEYLVYDEEGMAVRNEGTTIVAFSPLRDSYITYQGVLDPQTGDVPAWMGQVGVLVPGSNSRLANFSSDLERAKDMMTASTDDTAYFTWHGSPLPQFDLNHLNEPAQQGFADVGAPRLAVFVNSLRLAPSTDVVPIGHSYGCPVLGQAEALGLKAARVVYVAPAGLGHNVSGLQDFPETQDVPHFALQSRNDGAVSWNQGIPAGKAGHGPANPLSGDGITRLETGFLDADDPASGTIESTGPFPSHTAVFEPGSTSMTNIVNVVNGRPVSLYHPGGITHRGGRGGPGVVYRDGTEHPEELISPITLEEVDE